MSLRLAKMTFLADPCNSIGSNSLRQIEVCGIGFKINGISAKFLISIRNLLAATNWVVISKVSSKYLFNHLEEP